MNDECDYSYPDSPTHLSVNIEVHENKLPYPQFFGGVVLISREDFENSMDIQMNIGVMDFKI